MRIVETSTIESTCLEQAHRPGKDDPPPFLLLPVLARFLLVALQTLALLVLERRDSADFSLWYCSWCATLSPSTGELDLAAVSTRLDSTRVSLSLSVCLSISISLYLYLYLSRSLSLALCCYLYLYLSISLSVAISLYLSLSLALSLELRKGLELSLCSLLTKRALPCCPCSSSSSSSSR